MCSTTSRCFAAYGTQIARPFENSTEKKPISTAVNYCTHGACSRACSRALREYIVAYLVPRRDWRPRKKLVTILYINLRTIIDYIHRLRLKTRLNLRILFFGAKTNPGGDRVTFQLASSLSRRLKITNPRRIGKDSSVQRFAAKIG